MDTGRYVLNRAGEPVAEPDLEKWALFFENLDRRRVEFTRVGPAAVSTVFLAINHAWGEGPPVLWETMIFGGPMDNHQERCAGSREQAIAMHFDTVAKARRVHLSMGWRWRFCQWMRGWWK